MDTETRNRWQAKIEFEIPEEGREPEDRYHSYADGATPKELRKAILEKIKYLESNHRVVKTIIVVHTLTSYLTFTKDEYLKGKIKGKQE